MWNSVLKEPQFPIRIHRFLHQLTECPFRRSLAVLLLQTHYDAFCLILLKEFLNDTKNGTEGDPLRDNGVEGSEGGFSHGLACLGILFFYVDDSESDIECSDAGAELGEERKGWRLTLGKGETIVSYTIVRPCT